MICGKAAPAALMARRLFHCYNIHRAIDGYTFHDVSRIASKRESRGISFTCTLAMKGDAMNAITKKNGRHE